MKRSAHASRSETESVQLAGLLLKSFFRKSSVNYLSNKYTFQKDSLTQKYERSTEMTSRVVSSPINDTRANPHFCMLLIILQKHVYDSFKPTQSHVRVLSPATTRHFLHPYLHETEKRPYLQAFLHKRTDTPVRVHNDAFALIQWRRERESIGLEVRKLKI